MRRKYFLISLLVLLTTTISVAGILLTYFRTERIAFLDDQIRQSATSIIESKLSELKTYDDEEADEIISEELGPNRVGKFFVVRNHQGDVLFETQNVEILEMSIPQEPQWVTLTTPKHFVRALNLKLPRFQTRTLQVGAIVDANFISLTYINDRTWAAIGIILFVILILTWFLSAYLFSPINKLAQHLNLVTKSLESNSEVPMLPIKFSKSARVIGFQQQDEFHHLVHVLNEMVEKINLSRKFMKSWTFQMAHELKTPLTIVNRDFEVISEKYQVQESSVKEVQANIDKISQTVSSFLDWAELTTQKIPGNLYVVRLEDILTPILVNLRKIYGDRIEITKSEDYQILTNPLHLDQLITNALSNALKYSEATVQISFGQGHFAIKDQGVGIPEGVLERIGSPFNKGAGSKASQKGIGLGLAWIKTICDMYGWQFEFVVKDGTTLKVTFPPVMSGP